MVHGRPWSLRLVLSAATFASACGADPGGGGTMPDARWVAEFTGVEPGDHLELALDEEHVYVGAGRSGVFRVPRTGGDPEQVSEWESARLALSRTHVYFDSSSWAARVAKDGSDEDRKALEGTYVGDVAHGGERGYVLMQSGQVYEYETGKRLATLDSGFGSIEADDTAVYFGNDSLNRYTPSGGTASIDEALEPQDLAIDLTHLYVSTSTRLYRIDKAGGDPVLMAEKGAWRIAAGGAHVYIGASGLWRVSKEGRGVEAEPVAACDMVWVGVAADATEVFFSCGKHVYAIDAT